MAQDTGKFRTNTKDQFYTRSVIAKACVESLVATCPDVLSWTWIEPSAGAGAFLQHVPAGVRTLALDLEPKSPAVLRANFLEWTPPEAAAAQPPRLFFGNPPFGPQSSVAKAFLARAASFGDVLAFILPLSFTKPSMSRAIPRDFHLLFSTPLQKDAFEVNGRPYSVPCVFQVWRRQATPRLEAPKVEAVGFSYGKPTEVWGLAVRRVGGLAGRAFERGSGEYSPQSHYFVRLDECLRPHLKKVCAALCAHTFPSNTVGPRSLSKPEINEVLTPFLATLLPAAQPQQPQKPSS